jgi:hypothetical protein
MTFPERYYQEETWQGRVMIMEIYHLAMCNRVKSWTIRATAKEFNCSNGLASENLRLATAFHIDDKLRNCKSRQEAIKKLNGQ